MTESKQPSEGQIKEFWEWCLQKPVELRGGFWDECGDFCEMQSNPYSPQERKGKTLCYLEEVRELTTGEKEEYQADLSRGLAKWTPTKSEIWEEIPDLDLKNLFKYAVPKVDGVFKYDLDRGRHTWLIVLVMKPDVLIVGESEDPALALFWALLEVMKCRK